MSSFNEYENCNLEYGTYGNTLCVPKQNGTYGNTLCVPKQENVTSQYNILMMNNDARNDSARKTPRIDQRNLFTRNKQNKSPSSAIRRKSPSSAIRRKSSSSAIRMKSPSSEIGRKSPSSAIRRKSPSPTMRRKPPPSAIRHRLPRNATYLRSLEYLAKFDQYKSPCKIFMRI